MTPAGLSLDQSPPIAAPFRFFLTAPLFLLLAAALLGWEGPAVFASRALPATLALTHLLTLGVLAMVMCGALLQVLPVVVGAPVPRVGLVATLVHALLTTGTLSLAWGFWQSQAAALAVGATLLGAAFTVFLLAVGVGLSRAKSPGTAGRPLGVALLGLLGTATLGVALALGRAGALPMPSSTWANLHPALGLLAWTLVLVVAVASQVVPMFLVTPRYPRWVTAVLAPTLAGLVAAHGALGTLEVSSRRLVLPVVDVALMLGVMVFAAFTLHLLAQRKRKLPDPTLLLWRASMGSLGLAAALWGALPFVSDAGAEGLRLAVVVVMTAGFAVSAILAMLYRIVPFVAWFHLQGQGRSQAPHMKAFLSDRAAQGQAWGWVASLLLLAGALLGVPFTTPLAAATLGASSLWLALHLWGAVRVYRTALAPPGDGRFTLNHE